MAGTRKETMPTLEQYKTCCHCKQDKQLNCFNNDKNKADGKAVTCKECRSSQRLRLRSIDPKKYDEAGRRWRQNNKEFYAAWAFKNRHGITNEDVLNLVEEQGGCKICKTKSPVGENKWYVDHDHSCCNKGSCSKCRRGILCNNCNVLIGLAKEDITILNSAIEYLIQYGKDK